MTLQELREKRDKYFGQAISVLDEGVEKLANKRLEAEKKRIELEQKTTKYLTELTQKRQQELADLKAKFQKLNNEVAANNLNAAYVLLLIYFNYSVELLTEDDLVDYCTKLLDETLNLTVYKRLLSIPQLLPLLWPTDNEDFHQYTISSDGILQVGAYQSTFDELLPEYLPEVKKSIINVVSSNIIRIDQTIISNQSTVQKLENAISKFLAVQDHPKTEEQWHAYAFKFLGYCHKLMPVFTDWKLFAARGRKKVVTKPIRILPKHWPLLDSLNEFLNGSIVMCNYLISKVSPTVDLEGKPILEKPTLSNVDTGGQCFMTVDQEYKLDSNYWNYELIEVNLKDSEPEELDFIGTPCQDIIERDGQWKWKNPTEFISKQFYNDTKATTEQFNLKISRLGSKFMKSDFLSVALNDLTKNPDYKKHSPWHHPNRRIMSYGDFLTARISSPTPIFAEYFWSKLVGDSCKWTLVVPIDYTNSTFFINTVLKDTPFDRFLLDVNTTKINSSSIRSRATKYDPSKYQSVQLINVPADIAWQKQSVNEDTPSK